MPRLFVALDLPPDTREEIARICRGLPDVHWTDSDDLHLTLRFIGEVDTATFVEIGEALASITAPPFDISLKGIGCFPKSGPLRHLWTGVEGGEELARLKRRVDRAINDVGVEPEARRFTPHVTIARFRQSPPEGRMASWIGQRNLFQSRPFPVSSFNLVSSHLRSEGSDHVVEAEYDFVRGIMTR
ncbi:MAG: RNA 2',3'-cyclic phosphodiesterase [Geminicoccaceae bacterium]|nr:RNA 2',3'-cyclic phosphodiesterase [Geminicoccaceae bacterium]